MLDSARGARATVAFFTPLLVAWGVPCLLAALIIGGGSYVWDFVHRGQPGITIEEVSVVLPSDSIGTTMSLLCFNRPVQNEVVLAEMTRRHLRPVTYVELKALANQHPNKQRWFPIAELGDIWIDASGLQVCSYISSQGFRSTETAIVDAAGWSDEDMRFAAVPI